MSVENKLDVQFTKQADGYVAEVGCPKNGCPKWFNKKKPTREQAERAVLALRAKHCNKTGH